MHPEFFHIPILGIPIKMYGFFLMVGFLSAVWLAMRRAERVKANPDGVLDMAFLALIFGVIGARIFYVVHHWHPQFTSAPNRFLAIINIPQGGLEFLGGFFGAALAIVIYAARKKVSLRLYLDILAPSAMWGLAFGRVGCFLNGCCFGGMCTVPGTQESAYAWGVRFPFGSPAQVEQWEDRRVTVPAELIRAGGNSPLPWLLPADLLSMSVEKREKPFRAFEEAQRAYQQAQADAANAAEIAKRKNQMQSAKRIKEEHERKLAALTLAQLFPSRERPTRRTSVSELVELARRYRSQPVHPTQLYSAIHALLLSLFLSALFSIRKRHGVVIGALFIMYPLPRALLERIRVDNPVHIGGLTASQWVGAGMLIIGLVYLIILYTRLPERSPALEPYEGPTDT